MYNPNSFLTNKTNSMETSRLLMVTLTLGLMLYLEHIGHGAAGFIVLVVGTIGYLMSLRKE